MNPDPRLHPDARGRPAPEALDGAPAPGEPARPLRPGVLCTNCSYDLAGLNTEGHCPECGMPIAQTLAEPQSTAARMAHVPPRVARRLRLALLVLIFANLTWCVLFSLTIVVRSKPLLATLEDANLWMRGAHFAALLLSTTGWWLLLNRESEGTGLFIPVLSPEIAPLLMQLRVLTSLLTLALILAWPRAFDPDLPHLIVLLLLAVAVTGANLLLIPLQYDVVTERLRRLRRAKRPRLHGCIIAIALVVGCSIVASYVPRIVSIMFAVTPLALAGLLFVVRWALARHSTPPAAQPAENVP